MNSTRERDNNSILCCKYGDSYALYMYVKQDFLNKNDILRYKARGMNAPGSNPLRMTKSALIAHKVLIIPFSSYKTIDVTCALYLMNLSNLGIPVTAVDGAICLQLVDVKKRIVVANGLGEVVQWISYRQGVDDCIRALCGRSKEERRVVSRTIKRVLDWQSDWTDLSSIPSAQFADPLCPLVLFDKRVRHRGLNYLTEYTAEDNKTFASHKTYLMETLPSLLMYVKRARSIMKSIQSESQSQYGDDSTIKCIIPCWVDAIDNAANLTYSFRFTMDQELKTREAFQDSGEFLDDSMIESVSNVLVDMVCWPNDEQLIDYIDSAEDAGEGVESDSPSPSSNGISHESICIEHKEFEYDSESFWLAMALPKGRKTRKKHQINSLLEFAVKLVPFDGLAVEFCSGGGYLGIPLAFRRRDINVILTDMNSVSLNFAKQRVEQLGLNNVYFKLCEISSILKNISLIGRQSIGITSELREFDLGMSLHACGAASDDVISICKLSGANFVVSPCCYGFVQHAVFRCLSASNDQYSKEKSHITDRVAENHDISCKFDVDQSTTSTGCIYPQSSAFQNTGWKSIWFAQLCSKADRTFWSHDERSASHNATGRLAMKVIDSDRLLSAQECGYRVEAAHMTPFNATPKNHILIGELIKNVDYFPRAVATVKLSYY